MTDASSATPGHRSAMASIPVFRMRGFEVLNRTDDGEIMLAHPDGTQIIIRPAVDR